MSDIYYKKNPSLLERFEHAARGIWNVWQKEPNFRIEVFVALAVTVLMVILPLTALERAVLIIMIVLVLSLEIINSISEKILDIVHPRFSGKIKRIKDSMAGAVFLASLVSIAIGLLILLPVLLEFDLVALEWAGQFIDSWFFDFNKAITYLGSSLWVIVGGLLIAFLLLINKKFQSASFLGGLMIFGEGILWLIKELVARPRPLGAELIEVNGFSFPSGHTFSALIFWLGLAYVLTREKSLKDCKDVFWFVAVVIIVLVSASRFFLTVHWLSDILGGLVIGTIWFLLWLGINKKIFLFIQKR